MSSNNVPAMKAALRRALAQPPPNKIATLRLLFPEISELLVWGYKHQQICGILNELGLSITAKQLRDYCSRIRRSSKPLPSSITAGPVEQKLLAPSAQSAPRQPPASNSAEDLIATLGRDPFANVREYRKQDQKWVWNPRGNDDVLR